MKSLLTNHLSAPVVFFFLAAALCSFCTAESSTELAPIVQLKAGKVVGVVQTIKNGTGKVHKYEGIRYGLADRFAKPTAVPAWTNVYNATHSREKCPQMNLPSTNSTADIMLAMTQLTGENCLYLSIWRKADTINTSSASADLKPVMVFIHGGTYLAGSIFVSGGGQFLADGGDVIAVAIQYRLGALGLLTGTGIPANLQLLDQIFALKWIQENIAAFGGNPKQVTIFGESSGSMNVGQLILSPLARGLFSQAIMQSGGPLAFFGADNQTVADRKRATFATAIGCPAEPETSSVACLKQKPMADFINATLKMIVNNDFFVPVYGGNEVLPLSPAEALKVGAFNHLKAVIYGVNANEGSHIAVSSFPAVLSNSTKLTLELVRKELVKALKKFGVEYGEEVADYYLAELKHSANVSQDQLRVALANPLGDSILTCTTVLFGEGLATAKKVAGDN
ncbi:hypothetical protein TYRP_023014 [Tyrophagus putrescentiae]|nr:hypothetical protein TYRP_023014 [Tyrophagus putrescentiae]